MARFFAGQSFDVQTYDFNWFDRNFFEETLERNVDERIDGVLYRDALVVNGFNSGPDFWDDYYLAMAGSGITGSVDAGTIAGTVTLMSEFSLDASGTQTDWWGMSGFSLSARAIQNAGKTATLTDDRALFASALKGSDRIELSPFNDRMMGFAGNDTMYGYGGSDSLQGGTGRDHLHGGAGADVFVFDDGETGRGTSGRDVIFDFRPGTDDISLRLIDANTRRSGDQNFDFGGTRAGANDVWFARSGNNVIVYGDTNGDRKADFQIELRGVTSLTAGDFIL